MWNHPAMLRREFVHLMRPLVLIAALTGCALIYAGLGIPLLFGVGIYLAVWRLFPLRAPLDPAGKRPVPTAWGAGAFFTVVLVMVAHFSLLTRGTHELLGPELMGGAFDSLAQALLRGTTEVDPVAIRWEAFVVEGRSYMYFGPWPALLRVPAWILAPQLFGQWARLSCMIASALCLGGFALMSLRMIERNQALEPPARSLLLVTSLVGYGVATPLLFLMSSATIYHESILWGLAGSSCFMAVLVPRLDAPETLRIKLPLLAAIAGMTFLSRATYGAPLYLILLFVAGRELLVRTKSERPSGEGIAGQLGGLFVALLPAGAVLIFQLWYNFDRFGSPFILADFTLLQYIAQDPISMNVLEESGVFNLRRLPSALWNYFVPSAKMVSGDFPWFRITPAVHLDSFLYPTRFQSNVMPISVMSMWLVFAGSVGIAILCRRRGRSLSGLCLSAFLIQALLVSCYYITEVRYEADLMPLFAFGYGIFLAEVPVASFLRDRARTLAVPLVFAVAVSVVVTASGTLSGIVMGGEIHPNSYVIHLRENIRAVNGAMARH